MSGPSQQYADYLPERHQPAPTAPMGQPRPGHGKVYVVCDRRGDWSASWQDDYPAPRADGAVAGVEDFEGDQEAVLNWARSRPATEVIVLNPEPRTTKHHSGPVGDAAPGTREQQSE